MSKHTPGPWRRAKYKVFSAGESLVANTRSTGLASDADEANARLIAAAPDLLEALQWLVALMPDPDLDPDLVQRREVKRAIAVISKAKGESK